jgi:hypothetical protein
MADQIYSGSIRQMHVRWCVKNQQITAGSEAKVADIVAAQCAGSALGG